MDASCATGIDLRQIRDLARDYAQNRVMPRIIATNCGESTGI
jgi:hypothetical protein